MATYSELYGLWHESDLKNKVAVAVVVAAETIQDEVDTTPNHANRLIWAREALESTASKTDPMYRIILAENKDMTVAQILGASDTAIQNAVDGAVDLFATG